MASRTAVVDSGYVEQALAPAIVGQVGSNNRSGSHRIRGVPVRPVHAQDSRPVLPVMAVNLIGSDGPSAVTHGTRIASAFDLGDRVEKTLHRAIAGRTRSLARPEQACGGDYC